MLRHIAMKRPWELTLAVPVDIAAIPYIQVSASCDLDVCVDSGAN